MSRPLIAALVLCACSAVIATQAEAKTRRAPNDLVVTKRSFLDAGTMVKPGGYQTNYIQLGQGPLAQPVYSNINSRYGAETLPRRFEPAFAIGR